jgi:hypothetical protein
MIQQIVSFLKDVRCSLQISDGADGQDDLLGFLLVIYENNKIISSSGNQMTTIASS